MMTNEIAAGWFAVEVPRASTFLPQAAINPSAYFASLCLCVKDFYTIYTFYSAISSPISPSPPLHG